MEPYNSKARKRKAASRSNDEEDDCPEAREIVTNINPHDILLGRGAPTAYYGGNVSFRELVSAHKSEYIASRRHKRKQAITQEIFDEIAARGGRFLSKVETVVQTEQQTVLGLDASQKVWYVASKASAMEKIKQSLRDGDTIDATQMPSEGGSTTEQSTRTEPDGSYSGTVWNQLGLQTPAATMSEAIALQRMLHQAEQGRLRDQIEIRALRQQQQHQQQHEHPQQLLGAFPPRNHPAMSLLAQPPPSRSGINQTDLAFLLLQRQQQEQQESRLRHQDMVRYQELIDLEHLEREQRRFPLTVSRVATTASNEAILALALQQQRQQGAGALGVAHSDSSLSTSTMLRAQLAGMHTTPLENTTRQALTQPNPLSLLLLEEERSRTIQQQQRLQHDFITSQRLQQLASLGTAESGAMTREEVEALLQQLTSSSQHAPRLSDPLSDDRYAERPPALNNAPNTADVTAADLIRRGLEQRTHASASRLQSVANTGSSGSGVGGNLPLTLPHATTAGMGYDMGGSNGDISGNLQESLLKALLSRHAATLSSPLDNEGGGFRSSEASVSGAAATASFHRVSTNPDTQRRDDSTLSTSSEESDGKPRARETVTLPPPAQSSP